MAEYGLRNPDIAKPVPTQSQAEIDVIEIHDERLIETADVVPVLSPHRQTRSGHGRDFVGGAKAPQMIDVIGW